MNWECPRCHEELGELNGYCVFCKITDNTIIFNPDKYYIREIRINHITTGDKTVTPQEELFADLFNHEKSLVKDMDLLTLRAHREELAKIAFEARARFSAADHEEKERQKAINKAGKPQGFERSVNIDETTKDAINKIKERTKKLTKAEKIQQGLEKLGISTADAEKLMSAGTILGKLNETKAKNTMLGKNTHSPLSSTEGFVIQKSSEELGEIEKQNKPIFNPFEKK